MKPRVLLNIGVLLILLLAIGCQRDDVHELYSSQTLALYSIDGKNKAVGDATSDHEMFHGFPVLGKVEIEDDEIRRTLIESLEKAVANSDGTMAKCFWPRHAISAIKDGTTTQFVICFECLQMQVRSTEGLTTVAITQDTKIVFDKCLRDLQIQLAPR